MPDKKIGCGRIISFSFLAAAISMVWSLNVFFLPLFVTQHLKVSAFKIGFLVSLASLASLLISPLSGYFGDRLRTPLGRRRPIIIIGVVSAIVLLLILPGLKVYLHVAILAFFLFASAAAAENSFYALIPEVMPRPQLGLGVSILTIFRYGGAGLILVLGGIMWKINPAYPFYLVAITLLVSSVVTLTVIKEFALTENKKEKKALPFKEKWPDLKTKKDIISFYLAQFFWNFSLAAIFPFLSVYLQSRFHLEISEIYRWLPGLALAGILAILGAGFLTDFWGYRKTIALGVALLVMVTAFNLLKGEGNFGLLLMGLVIIPIAIIFSQAPAYLSHLIPAGREGEFFGYDSFSIAVAHVPAAWLSGFLIDRFGDAAMFFLSVLASLVSFIFIWKNLLRDRAQRSSH